MYIIRAQYCFTALLRRASDRRAPDRRLPYRRAPDRLSPNRWAPDRRAVDRLEPGRCYKLAIVTNNEFSFLFSFKEMKVRKASNKTS